MAYTEERIRRQEQEGLLWWRVELDKDGSIKSCSEGEYASAPARFVRYIQANTKEQAIAAAVAWYAKCQERRRLRGLKDRANRKEHGLCIVNGCKRRARPDKTLCQECSDERAARQRAKRVRVAEGDARDLRRHPAGIMGAFVAEKQRTKRAHERVVERFGSGASALYARLLRRFDELGAEAFRAWLITRIVENGGATPDWHPPMAMNEAPVPQAAE